MKVVAVIPARGGSKGVPAKNVRRVGGVPLVARAVASARTATLIDDVFVSTEDEQIALTAVDAGARIIERPLDIAGDTASSESALIHALDQIDASGEGADILVFIQSTSPFIEPADLDAAIQRVLDGESDVVFAAARTHGFLWRETENGAAGINHDERFRLRRQDSEPQFLETGAFYVMRVDGFRAAGHRFFGRVGIAVVPELTAIDVDTTDDLEVARRLAPFIEARVSTTGTNKKEESWSTSAQTT
jgi:N-acylneuraminate cytidylyltransferase